MSRRRCLNTHDMPLLRSAFNSTSEGLLSIRSFNLSPILPPGAPSFLRRTKSLMPWSRCPSFSPTDHVGIRMSTIKDDGDTMPHPLSSQENFAASTNPSDDECKASILSHITFRRAKSVVVTLGQVDSRRVLHVTEGQRTY